MSTVHASTEKKGHVCPPSNAKHPSDRWETTFIYSFMCKFTQLRNKVEGLESPMDLENALLSRDQDPVIAEILKQFVLNLRPQTRNLGADQITSTVASVLAEYFRPPNRSVFWSDDLKMNVDPFNGLDGTFFSQDWDFKLKVMRQLVELQLEHNADIKNSIDLAWGVQHNKHRKKEFQDPPPDPSDPMSKENLQLIPIGQDTQRKRYWVVDDSPRIYISTNPWKMAATFQTISSTRDEYIATVESLKASGPDDSKSSEKRSKVEQSHLTLVKSLEDRIEGIDNELNRVAKVRRRIEQRAVLQAQAEIRTTRTRRQTRRPDYVYNDFAHSEDEGDADDYKFQEDDDYDDPMDEDEFGDTSGSRRTSSRRSARNASGNSNGANPWGQWRGERRSTRLGAPIETQLDDPPRKRARTEDSTGSNSSANVTQDRCSPQTDDVIVKKSAAAVKPTEIAVEQVGKKRKSKFWFYAVEPVPGASDATAEVGSSAANGSDPPTVSNRFANGKSSGPPDMDISTKGTNGTDMDIDKHLGSSFSPTSISP